MTEDFVRHGTKPFTLPPSAIRAAAKADLGRCALNRKDAELGNWCSRRYAFLPRHVKNAKTVDDLLLRAAQDAAEMSGASDLAEIESSSERYWLYTHPEQLQKAIGLCDD